MRNLFFVSGAAVIAAVSSCQCDLEPLNTPKGDLEGIACDFDTGTPLANEQVIWRPASGTEAKIFADDTGYFTAKGVDAGEGTLVLSDKREIPFDVKAASSTNFVDDACGVRPGGKGGIDGRVCAPDGETWLGGATVSVDDGVHGVVSAVTDGDGRFSLEDVPSGDQILVIRKGSFESQRPVAVPAGGVLVIEDDDCAVETSVHIAVVHGSNYDNVEGVLADVGISGDDVDVYGQDWADQLLGSDDGLDGYDILFLSCRSYEPTFLADSEMQQRLRYFVQNGGSVHASDQAYDLIEAVWPNKIDFYGDDGVHGDADQGEADEIDGTVLDGGLAAALGHNHVDLHYGLNTWSVMEGAAADVHTYVKADVPLIEGDTLFNVPQIVSFSDGEGTVIYSSFHQETGISQDQEAILRQLLFAL